MDYKTNREATPTPYVVTLLLRARGTHYYDSFPADCDVSDKNDEPLMGKREIVTVCVCTRERERERERERVCMYVCVCVREGERERENGRVT